MPQWDTNESHDKELSKDLGNGYLSNLVIVLVGAPTMLTMNCALGTVQSITINLLQQNERMCIDLKAQIPADILGASQPYECKGFSQSRKTNVQSYLFSLKAN